MEPIRLRRVESRRWSLELLFVGDGQYTIQYQNDNGNSWSRFVKGGLYEARELYENMLSATPW